MSDLTLREWLAPQFEALNQRIDDLKEDVKDRLDAHEQMLIGNGQEGLIQRAVRNSARLTALEDVIGPHLTAEDVGKKKDRISLSGIAAVVAAIVSGIVAGVTSQK